MMYNLRKWCLKSFPCIVSHVNQIQRNIKKCTETKRYFQKLLQSTMIDCMMAAPVDNNGLQGSVWRLQPTIDDYEPTAQTTIDNCSWLQAGAEAIRADRFVPASCHSRGPFWVQKNAWEQHSEKQQGGISKNAIHLLLHWHDYLRNFI